MCARHFSRGFHGRRHEPAEGGRLPPGQYLVTDFPVLSAGPTPHTPLDRWTFSIEGEVDTPKRWAWEAFQALPHETINTDIHCVTHWSKLDTVWEGVSVDTLLEGVETAASYVVAFSDGVSIYGWKCTTDLRRSCTTGFRPRCTRDTRTRVPGPSCTTPLMIAPAVSSRQ